MSRTTFPLFQKNVLLMMLVVVAAGYSLVRFLIDRHNYNQGNEAYRQVNCPVASDYYQRVIDGWRIIDFGELAARAEQEKSECVAFKPILDQEQKGSLGEAVVGYNSFISNYPPDSYLVKVARDRTNRIFTQNQPAKLAVTQLCDNLTQLKPDLMEDRQTKFPPLHFACGNTYTTLKNYNQASAMYESFLDEYPNHPLTSQVKTAWAKTLVAQAQAEGAGSLPAPQQSGGGGGGLPVVTIQNDSPEPMRIVFSGPEGRIEELEACTNCQKYVGQAPESCPKLGPVGTYTLKPGSYDVVVKSRANRLVRPFKGTWSMNQGWTYNNCFYLVTGVNP